MSQRNPTSNCGGIVVLLVIFPNGRCVTLVYAAYKSRYHLAPMQAPEAGWSAEDLAHHVEDEPRSVERPERLRPQTVELGLAVDGNPLGTGSPSLVGGN